MSSYAFAGRASVLISLGIIAAGLPSGVLADNVVNDVVAGGSDTIIAGASTTIHYKIVATGQNIDGQAGCNAADGSPATVTIEAPPAVTVTPAALTFTTCGDFQAVTFSSSTPGSYAITATASDAGSGAYHTQPATFTLQVQGVAAPADTTPPQLTLPGDVIAEATGPGGATIHYAASAWDDEDGAITPACAPPSGSTFPIGITEVTCSATDAAGNAASGAFQVTLQDTTPPAVTLSGIEDGATYYYGFVPTAACAAEDLVDGALTCSISGAGANVGAHTATATATDAAGNTGSASATYVVAAWTLLGFHAPAQHAWNTAKAGSTIPLKFEIFAGPTELTSVAHVAGIDVRGAACPDATGSLAPASATGATSLRYDWTGGQYVFNWKTPATPGCYRVTVATADGSALSTGFVLK